jgi:hypothetical protein
MKDPITQEVKMQTWEEQQTFFEAQWPGLRQALEGGGEAAAAFALAFSDELERRVLFVFGASSLTEREWTGRNLDAYIAFCDAGITECLRQAAAAPDVETRDKRTDIANVISYNLAAGLADCWEDGNLRQRRHFKRGLQAAQDCIRWRLELDKGPAPFAMAYWAKGMHLLSLGDSAGAVESFQVGREYSRLAADEAGLGSTLGATADFGVVLAAGYLGLARSVAQMSGGDELYTQARAAFTEQLQDSARAEDAQFGLDQLRTARQRYAPPEAGEARSD